MKKSVKIIVSSFIILCVIGLFSCRSTGASNPYRTARVRPSERQIKEDTKTIKRMKRNYKKQLRSNRKYILGKKRAPWT
jgi:hypothetical protein